MKFRVPSNGNWLGEAARIRFVPGAAYTLITVGKCPGQFATDPAFPINSTCTVVAKQQDLLWNITTGSTSNCKLEPGATYYFNLINAANSNLTQSTCSSSSCGITVSHTGIDQ